MKWVTFYGQAQSTVLPQPATYAKNLTLRYPCYSPFKGNKIRIHLDNYCCDEAVTISKVVIGIAGDQKGTAKDFKNVYFNGSNQVEIAAHGTVVSDEVEFEVEANQYLVVNIFLNEYTNLTSGVDIVGPLSKGYFAYGDQSEFETLDKDTSKSTSWVYFLSNIDIYTDDSNECIVCYGDSITSQDWPDYMMLALKNKNINNIAVVRKAVSGTRVLREYSCITYQSYGLCGKKRFNHEVGSVSGCKKVIIQHGINDIIHPVGEEVNIFRPMSDLPTKEELLDGIKYYYDEATKMGLKVYVGNLLPIYNWRTYAPFREELKNSFNDGLKAYPNYIDFNSAVGDNFDGIWKFKEGFDSGDHLHPSKKAYEAMGNLAAVEVLK